MSGQQVLDELKGLGSAQTAKTYKRHGAGDNVYGVSAADMKTLVKRIKVDHALAQELWASGNYDARTLAMMIADPKKATADLLESWAGDVENKGECDALSTFIGKTSLAREKMERWTQSDDEWLGAVGWDVLGQIALNDTMLDDAYFEKYLTIIERDIHGQKNRVRHCMNNALIAIGTRNANLREKANAAAKKIGKVVVDHGDTDCKTPDAVAYMNKTWDRKMAKA